jgi:hippurate hydrolase
MQLTVRSYSDEVRTMLLDGIRQIAVDTCKTFECPRPPEVSIRKEYTPAVYNDPELVAVALEVFRAQFGEDRVVARLPSMGGEDFGRYARALGVPGLLFRIGAVDPELLAASQQPDGPRLASLHSSEFAPLPEPTLDTGVRAMTLLAIRLLQPEVPGQPGEGGAE